MMFCGDAEISDFISKDISTTVVIKSQKSCAVYDETGSSGIMKTLGRSIKDHLTSRWRNGNLRVLIMAAPDASDIDSVVNSTSVIAALLLAVPYAVVGSLSTSFFQGLREEGGFTCREGRVRFGLSDPAALQSVASAAITNCLVTTVTSCLYVLITTMLYYVFRPKVEEKFNLWWPRARFVLLLQVIGIVVGAEAAWFLLQNMLLFYVQYCDTNATFTYCAWIFWPVIVISLLLII